MNTTTVTAIVTIVAMLLATVLALVGTLSRRVQRIQLGSVEADFLEIERQLLHEIDEAAEATASSGIAWEAIERGDFRDEGLRSRFEVLLDRVGRLETASEKLGVRRQALLETYHNQGLSQSKVSFAFSLVLGFLGFVGSSDLRWG